MPYLAVIAGVAMLGIFVVLLRNRPRTSMESSIDHFQRGLQALAPNAGNTAPEPPLPTTNGGTAESD